MSDKELKKKMFLAYSWGFVMGSCAVLMGMWYIGTVM